MLDNLEEVLITSDVGVDTTLKIIDRIEKRVARDKYVTTQELTTLLRDEIASLLTENNTEDAEGFALPEGKKPYVIMVVGVNGVGKTTTIGKLAYQSRKPARRSIWRRRYVPCRRSRPAQGAAACCRFCRDRRRVRFYRDSDAS